MEIKVILPAKEIPTDSTVTKKGGTKEYKIYDGINIYNEKGEKQTIHNDGGVHFLIAETNSIGSVQGDLELIWITDTDELYQYLIRTKPY